MPSDSFWGESPSVGPSKEDRETGEVLDRWGDVVEQKAKEWDSENVEVMRIAIKTNSKTEQTDR